MLAAIRSPSSVLEVERLKRPALPPRELALKALIEFSHAEMTLIWVESVLHP